MSQNQISKRVTSDAIIKHLLVGDADPTLSSIRRVQRVVNKHPMLEELSESELSDAIRATIVELGSDDPPWCVEAMALPSGRTVYVASRTIEWEEQLLLGPRGRAETWDTFGKACQGLEFIEMKRAQVRANCKSIHNDDGHCILGRVLTLGSMHGQYDTSMYGSGEPALEFFDAKAPDSVLGVAIGRYELSDLQGRLATTAPGEGMTLQWGGSQYSLTGRELKEFVDWAVVQAPKVQAECLARYAGPVKNDGVLYVAGADNARDAARGASSWIQFERPGALLESVLLLREVSIKAGHAPATGFGPAGTAVVDGRECITRSELVVTPTTFLLRFGLPGKQVETPEYPVEELDALLNEPSGQEPSGENFERIGTKTFISISDDVMEFAVNVQEYESFIKPVTSFRPSANDGNAPSL